MAGVKLPQAYKTPLSSTSCLQIPHPNTQKYIPAFKMPTIPILNREIPASSSCNNYYIPSELVITSTAGMQHTQYHQS